MTTNVLCSWCNEPIEDLEAAVTLPIMGGPPHGFKSYRHEACNLRAVVGGLNHQLGKCICCGGTEPPDPEGMTRREAAIAAARHFLESI